MEPEFTFHILQAYNKSILYVFTMKDFLLDLVNECMSNLLVTEGARIQHAEDLIFWEGPSGATRAVKSLMDSAKGNSKNVTVKWDGSPAVVFGRNELGQFVFTDKNGFSAKGYDGKSKTPKELESMLLNRGGTPAEEKSESFKIFARNMANSFNVFEKSVPKNFTGYFFGDLLYMGKLSTDSNGDFVFKPNIVTYKVSRESHLGEKISRSSAGVVIHGKLDFNGNVTPVNKKDLDSFLGDGLCVIPPVSVEAKSEIDFKRVKSLLVYIKEHGKDISSLIHKKTLSDSKISDFPEILYTYLNNKVDTGLVDLGKDFVNWVSDNKKFSGSKKKNVIDHVNKNSRGFSSLWFIVSEIMDIKDSIISDLDKNSMVVRASIGEIPGGEGYVLSHPKGNIKFVSRSGFTAANRAVIRKESLVFEGGNVFKSEDGSLATGRISKLDVIPTVKWLESITSLPLVDNLLGTTGKKESSGDLDLAVDEKTITKDGLTKILTNWIVSQKLNPKDFVKKTGDSVHFKTPIQGDFKRGFVQTDFMFGDPTWMRWSLQGGKENSEYKGMHRHVLLASIAKFKNMKWSYKNGLVDRDTGTTITKDPSKIAVLLLGNGAKPSDLDYFESIIDRIKNNEDFENMVADARETLIKYGVKF